MKIEYRDKLRRRLASTAIGPSTIRRLAPAGTIDSARAFLENIELAQFADTESEAFEALLDRITSQYQRNVPQLSWGAARKFLNIFLRDCLYNRWVCDDYNLTAIERYLEVPLDRDVVEELQHRAGSETLPPWNGVGLLTEDDSKVFQQYARKVADAIEVLRVDLDIEYWRGEKALARRAKASAKKARGGIEPPKQGFSTLRATD